MGDLPASGYMSNNARTEAEMKQAFEDLRDVIDRTRGADRIETLTISAGSITPTTGAAFVNPEGGGATADNLDNIATTNAVDGWIIELFNGTSTALTVRDNQGAGTVRIFLAGGTDFTMTAGGQSIMLRWNSAIGWIEVARRFRGDAAAERSYLGLGDAALANVGPGNGLDADTLDGQHASAFLGVAAQAADSALLDGKPASTFADKVTSALQSFAANVESQGGELIASLTAGNAPGLVLQTIGGTPDPNIRGRVFWDDTNGYMIARTEEAGAVRAQLKVPGAAKLPSTPGDPMEYAPGGGSFSEVWTDDTLPLHPTLLDTVHTLDLAFGSNVGVLAELPRMSLQMQYSAAWENAGATSAYLWDHVSISPYATSSITGQSNASDASIDDNSTSPPSDPDDMTHHYRVFYQELGESVPQVVYVRVRTIYFSDFPGDA